MGGQTGERKGHRVKKQEVGWEAAERKEGPWVSRKKEDRNGSCRAHHEKNTGPKMVCGRFMSKNSNKESWEHSRARGGLPRSW